MKIIILISLLIFCAITATKAQFPYTPFPAKPSESIKYKTAGIKTCKRYQVDSVYKDSVLKEIWMYNAMGRVETAYELGTNNDGDPDTSCTTYNTYTTLGYPLRSMIYDKEQGEIISLNTYNAAGKILTKEVATIDPPTYTYIYDATGKIKEVKVTQKLPGMDKDGNFTGKPFDLYSYRYTYTYNTKGQVTEEKMYNVRQDDKQFSSVLKFTYNTQGNITNITNYNSEKVIMYIKDYKYNTQGFLTDSWYADDLKSPRVWSIYVWGK